MFEPPARAPARVQTPIAPTILSAHSSSEKKIAIVFSHEIDAASLYPSGFLVGFPEGTRSFPREAVLSPSNESDENRTVVLSGDNLVDAEGRPPTDVMVVGTIYTENGAKLQGLASPITPLETADGVVLAQRLLPSAGVCTGAAQAVRTFWSDALRGVEREDLARIDITLDDASTVHPIGFDDHVLDDQDQEDNVLDLCIAQESPAQRVTIAAGVFTDAAGHPTAAVEQPIVSADP